jgi:hypothetical protein
MPLYASLHYTHHFVSQIPQTVLDKAKEIIDEAMLSPFLDVAGKMQQKQYAEWLKQQARLKEEWRACTRESIDLKNHLQVARPIDRLIVLYCTAL